MTLEAFLDETPGEVRGVIARDGRHERLLIHRDGDIAAHRLGAQSIGRIEAIDSGLNGAFVDLGTDQAAYLPPGKGPVGRVGEMIHVEVTAEPRAGKGATVKRLGAGEGPPRLVQAGPDVRAFLAEWAPGAEIQQGLAAIEASLEAEEQALASTVVLSELGLDLAVQRTRALVAVDIDHARLPGRDAARGRDQANRAGLFQAARLIRLKGWGGLVVIDVVGSGRDGDALLAAARAAFGGDPRTSRHIAYGPVSRFGVLQVAVPWQSTPIEERLNDPDGRRSLQTRAIAVVRALRRALLSDTATPRHVARCCPEEAALAAPLVAALGPRAGVIADPTILSGRCHIEGV